MIFTFSVVFSYKIFNNKKTILKGSYLPTRKLLISDNKSASNHFNIQLVSIKYKGVIPLVHSFELSREIFLGNYRHAFSKIGTLFVDRFYWVPPK